MKQINGINHVELEFCITNETSISKLDEFVNKHQLIKSFRDGKNIYYLVPETVAFEFSTTNFDEQIDMPLLPLYIGLFYLVVIGLIIFLSIHYNW
ncbi:MAG: hypothetical protein ACHQF4_02330 [Sphingobacteriales bacterium]